MKKLSAFGGATLGATLLATLIAGDVAAADGPIGTVEKVKPDAFGTPPSAERVTLGAADRVVEDENIETGETGSLHIKFIDDTNLWLDENSALVLDEMVFERDATTGKFIAELGPGLFRIVTGALPHESYEVRTPVAVIGVRGTDFSVAVGKNGATRVTSYDQAITIRARAGGPSVTSPPASTASIGKVNGPVNVDPLAPPVAPPGDSLADRELPPIDVPEIGGVGGGGKVGHSPPGNPS